MRGIMMALGLVRTLVGQDYRSKGKRLQLQRMGRELVTESLKRFHVPENESGGETNLKPHPNAPSG